jgi:hypothetical protein
MKKKPRIRSGRIAQMRRRWTAISLPNRVAILGLVVAVLGDDLIIETPNLAGNDPAQNKITALLLERGGVKIETDETEDYRPHSQVRLVLTGQHERPVLITGLRANVVRRERPCPRPLSGAHPKVQARTSRWG